jgi:hypothetical protein
MLASLALPLGAQEGEAPAKPDPEVDKQIAQFKDAVNEKDRSRDDEAMNLIDKLTGAYATMHAKDQKNVRKTLEECLISTKVVRPPEHSGLFLAAASGLAKMAPEGTKVLVKAYSASKFDKNDWVPVRAELLKKVGETGEVEHVDFLVKAAMRDPNDLIKQAAGGALGNFHGAEQQVRKEVVGELVKMFNEVYNAAHANVDPNDPNVQRGKETLAAIQDSWNKTLQLLTKQSITSPPDWQTFMNKSGKKDWDKPAG